MNVRRVAEILLPAVLVLVAILSAAQAFRNAVVVNGSQDFQWDPAWVLLRQINPYELNLSGLPAPTDGQTPNIMEANQVPSALMLLWPYAWMSWPAAKVLWAISNFVFTAGILFFTFRLFLPKRSVGTYLIVASLLCAGLPWRNLVGNGQHLLFSLVFFLAALWYAERSRWITAGVMLALSFFKYTTVFALLPYFLYKRWYRPVVIAFGLHALATLFAAAWVRESPITLVVQSLRVSSALEGSGFLDVFAVAKHAGLADAAGLPWLASALLLGVAVYACIRKRDADPLHVLTALALVSTVVIYHRGYDFVVLLFPLAALVAGRVEHRLVSALLIATIAMTWFIDKVVYMLYPEYITVPGLLPLPAPYYWSEVVIWYAAVLGSLWLLLRGGRPMKAAVTTEHQHVPVAA